MTDTIQYVHLIVWSVDWMELLMFGIPPIFQWLKLVKLSFGSLSMSGCEDDLCNLDAKHSLNGLEDNDIFSKSGDESKLTRSSAHN